MTRPQLVIIAVYFALLLTLIGTAILSNFLSPLTKDVILPVTVDGIKTVIAALVGSLSVILGGKSQD